ILLDRAIDGERMAAIAAEARTRPGVLAATGRTQFIGDIEVNGHPREIPLQVFVAAPDDPMRMAKLDVQHGRWPPSPREIFIGPDSLALLDVAVGAAVTVKIPSGEPARLRVAGVVYDPSLAPAPQHQMGHAYLSTAPLTASGSRAVLDQLKIQVAEPGRATPSRDRRAVVAGGAPGWTRLRRGHRPGGRQRPGPAPR